MATTLEYSPNDNDRFKCSANRLDFLYRNSDTSVSSMEFIFTAYNPVTAAVLNTLTLDVVKDGQGNYYKDFSSIAQRSLSYDIPQQGDAKPCYNSSLDINVTVNGVSETVRIFNSFLTKREWRGSNKYPYIFDKTDLFFPTKYHLISNYDNKIDVNGANFMIQSYFANLGTLRGYKITTYNSAGTIENTGTILYVSSFFTYNNGSVMCDVGTNNILNVLGSMFFTNAVRYKVEVEYTDLTTQGVPVWFTLVDYCKEPVRLHWLNKLGGFDCFDFVLNKVKAITAEKVEYTSLGYAIDGTDVIDNLLNLKSSYVKRGETLTIESDWVNDLESEILSELVTSRLVMIERNTGYLTSEYESVTVNNKQTVVKNTNNDFIYNYSFDLILNENNSQVL